MRNNLGADTEKTSIDKIMPETTTAPEKTTPETAAPTVVARHGWLTRIWHWVNALCLIILLMSGLTIFNAHPRLYWGDSGNVHDPAWAAVASGADDAYVRIGSTIIPSTGFMGHWRDDNGRVQNWAFPSWATIPGYYDLAAGRRWHLFFAWIFSIGLTLYMLGALLGRHISRNLHMRGKDWQPNSLWASIKSHAKGQFAQKETDAENDQIYNPLQKLSYIAIIFIALPLMIATGLAMSPQMNAAMPWLPELFGGRQSARSVHFIVAFSLLAFTLLHIILVLVSRPLWLLKSMTIGAARKSQEGAA